jgi:DNA repair protein RecO (recombination protein O)
MLVCTEGIILHKTKYSDHSLIVKIYTEKFGTQDFIIKNALSKANKNSVAKWANLALAEINYNKGGQTHLHYIKELTPLHINTVVPYDMARNAILIFYNELLYKLLYDAGEDALLFSFLKKSLLQLDTPTARVKDMHLCFLVSLMQLLGFSPVENYSKRTPYFSIEAAAFLPYALDNPYFFSKPCSEYFYKLLTNSKSGYLAPIEALKPLRMELLHGLLCYFEQHNEQLSKMESVAILSEILE